MLNWSKLKLTGIVLLALAPLALLTGYCSEQQPVRYQNIDYHFSLDIPAKWQQRQKNAKELVALSGPKINNFYANVNVANGLVGNIGLVEYMNITRKQFADISTRKSSKSPNALQSGITQVKVYDEKAMKLGGLAARSWRMRIDAPKHPTVEERQVYCMKDKHVFVVTFTSLQRDLKTNDPVFDKLLASFRWDGG